jgi:hypothetical protein
MSVMFGNPAVLAPSEIAATIALRQAQKNDRLAGDPNLRALNGASHDVR